CFGLSLDKLKTVFLSNVLLKSYAVITVSNAARSERSAVVVQRQAILVVQMVVVRRLDSESNQPVVLPIHVRTSKAHFAIKLLKRRSDTMHNRTSTNIRDIAQINIRFEEHP